MPDTVGFSLFTTPIAEFGSSGNGVPFHSVAALGYVLSKQDLSQITDYYASLVPLGVGFVLFQASIYDVPGGYRAVMFDRFSGVKDVVRRHHFRLLVVGYTHSYNVGYW